VGRAGGAQQAGGANALVQLGELGRVLGEPLAELALADAPREQVRLVDPERFLGAQHAQQVLAGPRLAVVQARVAQGARAVAAPAPPNGRGRGGHLEARRHEALAGQDGARARLHFRHAHVEPLPVADGARHAPAPQALDARAQQAAEEALVQPSAKEAAHRPLHVEGGLVVHVVGALEPGEVYELPDPRLPLDHQAVPRQPPLGRHPPAQIPPRHALNTLHVPGVCVSQ